MRLLLTIAVLAVLPLATAACGADDASTSGQEASDRAGEIAVDLGALSKEVEQRAQEVADDPQAADEAKAQLEDAAKRAEELAQQARDDLPEDEPSRSDLEQAAQSLQSSAEDAAGDANGDAAAKQARDARDRLRSAADEVRDRVPEDVQGELESLLGN